MKAPDTIVSDRRRSKETAVVILEPRPLDGEGA